jgi:alpha-galactosidase/6-phospho-beta-glucosidase family protein
MAGFELVRLANVNEKDRRGLKARFYGINHQIFDRRRTF